MLKSTLQKNEETTNLPKAGSFLLKQTDLYLAPFLTHLDTKIDARLVRTFRALFCTILLHRDTRLGLVISELGKFICGIRHAAAGTKRISNLLRCCKWTHQDIADYTLEQVDTYFQDLRGQGKRVLMLWDDSEVEKNESWLSGGLCSVPSSKGRRLTRIRKGFYGKHRRINVPGYHWSAAVMTAWGEKCQSALMRWWTTRGRHKDNADNIFYCMLRDLSERFGNLVVHVFDRGYANLPTLERLWKFNQFFIVRWKTNHLLQMQDGQIKQTHLVIRSYKSKNYRTVWDKERKKTRRVGIAYAPVWHPQHPDKQLFIVIVRDKKKHQKPMYILTNLHLDSIGMAWQIFFEYMHRWSIEQTFRFMKTELAIESVRLWFFNNKLKLFALVGMVYDFIIRLARKWKGWALIIVHNYCPRTGKRQRKINSVPLYRFRSAISEILKIGFYQNSG